MVPLDINLAQCPHGVEWRVGNDRDTARSCSRHDGAGRHRTQHDHFAHPRQRLCRRAVSAQHFAAEGRAHRDAGIEQAGRQHIDRVNRRAIELGRVVDAPNGLANQLELLRGLEGHGLRQRQSRSLRSKFAERAAPARSVQDLSILCAAIADRNAPLHCRRTDQHGACRCSGFAHGKPLIGETRRPARALQSGYFAQ